MRREFYGGMVIPQLNYKRSLDYMLSKKLLTASLILTFVCVMMAAAVPAPVLHFDAADNAAHPKGWTNLGTAGGELEKLGKFGFAEAGGGEPAQYFGQEQGSVFNSEDGEPSVNLESWTIEILMKNIGPLWGPEEQIFAISAIPMQLEQAVRAWIDSDWVVNEGTGRIGLIFKGKDTVQETAPSNTANMQIGAEGAGEWHWVSFVYDDDIGYYEGYLDGELVDEKITAQDFDPTLDMPIVRIFAADGIPRNFNGAISVFTVYDEVLTVDQLSANNTTAVDPTSKLAATWGRVKTTY